VLVGDFTGNGIADLALANSTANTVSIVLGNGDGTFQPEIRYLAGAGSNAVVAADFNGDGALDLATANAVSGTVSVLLNRNDGRSPPPGGQSGTRPHTPTSPTSVAALDALFGAAQAAGERERGWPAARGRAGAAASRPEAVLAPQVWDDASLLPVHHKRDRANTAELADLVAGDFGLLE
jgi:hypothetical protein